MRHAWRYEQVLVPPDVACRCGTRLLLLRQAGERLVTRCPDCGRTELAALPRTPQEATP
jgi:hypothetical protein